MPLSPNASAWLAVLSDPLSRHPTPDRRLAAIELPHLIAAASAHGVMPAVARNLRALSAAGRGTTLIDSVAAQNIVETFSGDLDRRLLALVGQNLLLAHHGARIAAAIARDGIPASIVKGPAFSRRLYPRSADRSFTDIDVLVSPASLAASFAILERLGFVMAPGNNRGRDYGEYKWLLPGNELILIEVQTNLIHSPHLGTGIRLQHADLLAAGGGDAEDATALLLVAAVHGAAGHQFERLQPAVDVLQAARGVAGPIDRHRLARVSHATGSTAALQTALDLTADLFNEPAARELAGSLSPTPWRRLRRNLVSPTVTLRAQSRFAGRDSWRRRALREVIRRIGKATISRGT